MALFIRDIMFYLAWEPLLPGLYFHLLALWCVYSSVLYFPQPRGFTLPFPFPLPLCFLPLLPREFFQQQFPFYYTFLPVGFYRLSPSSSSLSFSLPQPLSCSPCLCFMPPFPYHPSPVSAHPRPRPTTRFIPSSPLIRSLCFSPTCVPHLFPSRLPNRQRWARSNSRAVIFNRFTSGSLVESHRRTLE